MRARHAKPPEAGPRKQRSKFAVAAVAVVALLVLPASAVGQFDLPGVGRIGEPSIDSMTITPVGDTYADSLAQDRNFGERTLLRLNQDRKYTRIIYVGFEVAGIPAGATVVSATLTLSPTESRTFSVRAHLTDAFDESALTWNDRPPVGVMLSESGPPQVGEPVVFDVTAAISGDGPVNMAITASGRIQPSTWFPASESADGSPQLEVTWSGGDFDSPEPTRTPVPKPTPTVTPTTKPSLTPTPTPEPTPTPTDPGPPPPPRSSGEDPMLVGATVKAHDGRSNTADEVAFLESHVGKLEIRRVFDPGFDRDFRHKAGLDIGRRATHYSFKPDMTALAAGSLDDDIRTFLDTIPDSHRTILTIWHEPENNFTTAGQQAEYREGWRRFAQLVEAENRPELSTSWVLMAYSFRAVSGRNPEDWWPGDGVVDIVGIDTYNDGSLDGTAWYSPGRAFGQPAAGDKSPGSFVAGGILGFLDQHNVLFGVAEFGTLENTDGLTAAWTDTPTKAAWIRDAVNYYQSIGAVYVEYFHSGPYRGPWWLDYSSDEPLVAYRDMIAKF
jgi:hypothetical protein